MLSLVHVFARGISLMRLASDIEYFNDYQSTLPWSNSVEFDILDKLSHRAQALCHFRDLC